MAAELEAQIAARVWKIEKSVRDRVDEGDVIEEGAILAMVE